MKVFIIGAYNPRANSVVEGANNTTSNVIVKMMEGETKHWQLFVPLTQLLCNNKIKSNTRSSPFSLMLNRQMNELIDYTGTEIKPVTEDTWREHQADVIALVFPAIEARQLKMTKAAKEKFEARRRKLLTADLPKGMEVMIRDPQYEKGAPRPREAQRNIGPYTIVRRLYNGPYVVEDKTGSQRRVPIDQIVFTRTSKHPAVVSKLDEEMPIYEVKEIIDSRLDEDAGLVEYLVWWKGYPKEEATWEPITNINSTSLIRAYNNKTKKAEALRQAADGSVRQDGLDLRRRRKPRSRK